MPGFGRGGRSPKAVEEFHKLLSAREIGNEEPVDMLLKMPQSLQTEGSRFWSASKSGWRG